MQTKSRFSLPIVTSLLLKKRRKKTEKKHIYWKICRASLRVLCTERDSPLGICRSLHFRSNRSWALIGPWTKVAICSNFADRSAVEGRTRSVPALRDTSCDVRCDCCAERPTQNTIGQSGDEPDLPAAGDGRSSDFVNWCTAAGRSANNAVCRSIEFDLAAVNTDRTCRVLPACFHRSKPTCFHFWVRGSNDHLDLLWFVLWFVGRVPMSMSWVLQSKMLEDDIIWSIVFVLFSFVSVCVCVCLIWN